MNEQQDIGPETPELGEGADASTPAPLSDTEPEARVEDAHAPRPVIEAATKELGSSAGSDAASPLHGAVLARSLADRCYEKKGDRVVILDVREALGVTDFFVVCSAQSERQCKVIAQHCDQSIKAQKGYRVAPMEGARAGEGGWICGDFGDVILHVFVQELRDFYDLENNWGDVPRLDWAPSPDLVIELPGSRGGGSANNEEYYF